MRKQKRILSLTLALVLALALAACGGQTQKPDTNATIPVDMPGPDSATIPADMPKSSDEIPGEIPAEITYSFSDGVLTVSGSGEITRTGWYSAVSNAIYETNSDKIHDAVKEIVIEEGTFAIGKEAFERCHNLTKVTVPDSVRYIGEEAFSQCDALTDITLPSNLTSIGKRAFSSCKSLSRINIPENVTEIECQAFQYSGLTEITVPASVRTWDDGDSPFSGCKNLTDITYLCDGNIDSIAAMLPSTNNQTITVHAAAGSFIAGYLDKQHSEGNRTQYVFEPLG